MQDLTQQTQSRAGTPAFLRIAPWWSWAGLLLSLGLFASQAGMFSSYVNDDAYITFRYSRFLSLGRGPFYNVGEHVEGYSNPLLMVLIAAAIKLFGAVFAAPVAKLIGLLSGLGSIVLAWLWARSLHAQGQAQGQAAGVAAACLTAACTGVAVNSMSGLETTLFGCCLMMGVWLGVQSTRRARFLGSGLWFAAAVLTRPEGAMFFVVYLVAQTATSYFDESARCGRPFRRVASAHLIPDTLIVVAVVLGHLALRMTLYDGEWLPNTYYAKAGGFWGNAYAYVLQGTLPPLGGLLGIAAAITGWLMRGPRGSGALPMAAVAISGGALPLVTGSDWMLGHRMTAPFIPMLAALVAVGWMRCIQSLPGRMSWLAAALACLAVGSAWSAQAIERGSLREQIELRGRGYQNGHLALAHWLRDSSARPNDTIAMMDIGLVGYTCINQNMLDISGLTDRYIAKRPGGFLRKRYDVRYVLERKPRFIVIVLQSPGDSSRPPASNARFTPWLEAEAALLSHPSFREHYLRRAKLADTSGRPWLERLAARLGATRAFLHDYPGAYYVLAAFEEQIQERVTPA